MNFINIILQAVPGIVVAFLTPQRIKALIGAVSRTIDYVSALNNDDPADDYKAAEAFMIAQYDLLDEVAGFDDTVDNTAKTVLIPFLLSFIYSDGRPA